MTIWLTREKGCNIYNVIVLLQRCSYGVAAGEDSADILPVEDNVGEATNTRPFGSIYPVMRVSRWQLNQPAAKDSGPSSGELNNQ